MSLTLKAQIADLLRLALLRVAPSEANTPITIERPKQAEHGDFSCNLAMQLARAMKRNPRELAKLLLAELPASPLIDKVDIAGAGFINFHLVASAKLSVLRDVLQQGEAFGRSHSGRGKKVQVEFVSANPTGPLHVGHGRGAAYGASLANLLAYADWDVTREYYVNDAGRQMDILSISAWLRYLELHAETTNEANEANEAIPFPPNAYQGDYVRAMAQHLQAVHGSQYVRSRSAILEGVADLPEQASEALLQQQRDTYLDALIANAKKLLGEDWYAVHRHVLNEQLADGREDLEEFGVLFDVWFSEQALFDTGLIARCLARLEKDGHLYVQNGAKWFKSTHFGDEKDRVVQRENGLFTYFASDIAYHLNKYERGFDRIINVWGADHHGYIARVKGALSALKLDPAALEIALVQFAVLYRDGVKTSMSTRSGEFVTLRQLRAEVGNDACRFFYVSRKSDQHLDFDLDLAKSQSNDNPVYYIQYAHARICSVLAQALAADAEPEPSALSEWAENAQLSLLSQTRELALAAKLSEFPELIESAAQELSPHLLAFYLKELAAQFHAYYNAERILLSDTALQTARLALIAATRQVIRNGMAIIGVSCPTSM
ncbi:MAG: arginine--tRNA ligase [Pseudomonadota bacterium]